MTFKKTALAIAMGSLSLVANASSHREAPFIAQNPSVDGTDFYLFRSYGDSRPLTGAGGYVTILANYNPLQDTYGGPNYFALNPNALYEIHVDNNGDGVEDLTFQFKFTNTFAGTAVNGNPNPSAGSSTAAVNSPIPLINLPPDANGNPTLTRTESYTVGLVRGPRRSSGATLLTNPVSGNTTFVKPVDNIGNKSIPNYDTYAAQYIYNNVAIPGCSAGTGRVFVGQRQEGFNVNLGEVFDLVNLNPLGKRTGNPNTLGGKDVTTLALELPAACLTAGSETVIGAWTTSSLRQGRVLNPTPQGPVSAPGQTKKGPEVAGGAWVQVSRLGSPLVNEVVIGITDKDKFNASEPKNDPTNFANYVLYPTLPVLLNALFGNAAKVPPTPRNDIAAAFLTGVAGVNQPANVKLAEMLRLNTALPATPQASQVNAGAALCFNSSDGQLNLANAGCDPAGFPNGRRPGDDVVDIELSVVEGFLLGAANPNKDANGNYQVYTDGSSNSATAYLNAFPYLNSPIPGSPNGKNVFPADAN